MVLSDFTNSVIEMASRYGAIFPDKSNQSGIQALMMEGMNTYARCAKVFFNSNVAFTPPTGLQTIQTYSSYNDDGFTLVNGVWTRVLAYPMCSVDLVVIGGVTLARCDPNNGASWAQPNMIGAPWTGEDVEYGESSEADMIAWNPNYLSSAAGTPCFWYQKNPNWVVFNCPIAAGLTACSMSGCLYHTPLTSQSQILDFATEDLRPAARVCRNLLLETYNAEFGEGGPYYTAAMTQMEKRAAQSETRSVGNPQRSARRDGYSGVWLGG